MKEKAAVEVQRSPTRCPYCHEECRSSESNVACHECLARHHAGCWDEAASCASCGCDRRMEPAARAPLTRERIVSALVEAGHTREEVEAALDALRPEALRPEPPAPSEFDWRDALTITAGLAMLLASMGLVPSGFAPFNGLHAVGWLVVLVVAFRSGSALYAFCTPAILAVAYALGLVLSQTVYSSEKVAIGALLMLAGGLAAGLAPRLVHRLGAKSGARRKPQPRP